MKLFVNGIERNFEAPPLKRLLDVLREDLGLTGTKEGCGEGECGACAVLVAEAGPDRLLGAAAGPGELVNSCLVPVCQVEGASILTIEGVAAGGPLTTLQQCFLERGGAQCGICTPGMIVAAHRFLASGKPATSENVREAIAGNLCRCTGYAKIVEAIQLAANGAAPAGPRGERR